MGLTHEEFQRLKRDDPRELDRRALAERRDFVFGVRDERAAFARNEWGGEFRVFVNQNVVLHLVPSYNGEMERPEELPEFCILPDDARRGQDATVRYEGVKDLDAFEGVHFYVSRDAYEKLVGELAGIVERYAEYPRLPDSLYGATEIVKLIASRVLEHPLVRAEREYDFTKWSF